MGYGAAIGAGAQAGAGLLSTGLAALLAGEGGEPQLRQVVDLWQGLQTPTYDDRELIAPQLREIASRMPQSYAAQIAQGVALPEDSPEVRSSQLGALGHLDRVRKEGLPLAERLAADEQVQRLGRGLRSNREAFQQNLRSRGRYGAGAEIAAGLAGNSEAATAAAQSGSELARQAAFNRINAAMASGSLGGQIRGQDQAHQSARSNALNRFNEFVSTLQTGAQRDAAASRERADAYNVGNQQRIGDTNALAQYQNQASNLNRTNALRGQGFQDDVQRLGGLSNALGLGGLAGGLYGEQAARRDNIYGIGQQIGGAGGALGGAFGGSSGGASGGVRVPSRSPYSAEYSGQFQPYNNPFDINYGPGY